MKSNHYTHSLYYKLLIGYLIFGLLGFITIATISSEMTYHHLDPFQQRTLSFYA